MSPNEIIIYEPNYLPTHLEVQVKDDTVWLNRQQLALLYGRDVKTIGKHILNARKEELRGVSVGAKFATTATDGKVYQVEHYNLDMILSLGYRVKSARGVEFRIWTNTILKKYLLKGYAMHNRVEMLEAKVVKLEQNNQKFDLMLNTKLPPNQGIFFDGEVFDAYVFVSKLIKSAKKSIVLIDNYSDETVLALLSKRQPKVKASIYLNKIDAAFQLDIEKHNSQYAVIDVHLFKKSHDRFLILDQKEVYHIGASLKDLGKKWFAFSKLNIDSKEIISRLAAQPQS